MRTLAKYVATQGAGLLALTLTGELCLPLALHLTGSDEWSPLFILTTMIGVIGGFALYYPERGRLRAATYWLVGGSGFLFLYIGEVGGALWASAQASLHVLPILLLPLDGTGIRADSLAAWVTAQHELITEIAAYSQRIAFWLVSLLRGGTFDDPAARVFCISLSLWLLAGWASWRIARGKDALGGLLPTTVALALALNFAAQDRWPLWLHLPAFLLLLAMSNLASLMGTWKERHTDFSDSITIDSVTAAIVVIMLIVSTAFVVSAFSIRDLIDRLREQQQPTTGAVSGSNAGPASPSIRATHRPEFALPTAHPIASGPNLSHDVAMYVSTTELPALYQTVEITAPRYYWRHLTFQTYTGAGWTNPDGNKQQFEPDSNLVPGAPDHYREIHATVTFPAGIPAEFYWSGALRSSDRPLDVIWRAKPRGSTQPGGSDPFLDADMIGAFIQQGADTSMQTYEFDAWIPDVGEDTLKASPATYPDWVRDKYLQLPNTVPLRVLVLANDLTSQARTPYERAAALEAYLRKIPYSVQVPAPPPGRDAADYFLFSLRKGYCDYYATAMTVLARGAGLPARMVVGYSSGRYDGGSARYIVTQANAHTWTEIYFSGIGWIEFEPTSNEPAPVREGMPLHPQANQSNTPLAQILHRLPAPGRQLIGIAWLLLAAPASLWLAWLAIDTWRLSRMEPETAAGRIYIRMRRAAGSVLGSSSVGETPMEYASRLSEAIKELGKGNQAVHAFLAPVPGLVAAITGLHMQALFAPVPLNRGDQNRLIRAWGRLHWRLTVLSAVREIRRVAGLRGRAPSTPPGAQAE